MDLLPSEEQQELIAATAAFLAAEWPTARMRKRIQECDPVDASTWRSAAQLGWFALGLPEAAGGIGGSLADEALVFREIGRSLAPGPFVATLLGARVAAQGGRPDLALAIASGALRVGLAEGAAGPVIAGRLRLIDAVGAEQLLVADASGAALVASESLPERIPAEAIDDATRLAYASVSDAAATAFVSASQDAIFRRGLVLAAALLVGNAEATRDVAALHAKNRVQFGKPIGVHQAIKHPCADAALRAEAAFAQTAFAALAHDEARGDADFHAVSAKLVAADAALQNAATAIQVLGGMGFTYEHDANLYAKRAYVLSQIFGSTRDLLARLLELPPAR